MKETRKLAKKERVRTPGQTGLLLTLLWDTNGVRPEDVLPLVCYACDVPSARDVAFLTSLSGTTLSFRGAGEDDDDDAEEDSSSKKGRHQNQKQEEKTTLSSEGFAELVLYCERENIKVTWDDRYSPLERRFAYASGLVPLTARARVRRRALFLRTVFVSFDSEAVPLKSLHAALVAVGETVTSKDLMGTLLADGETSLDNLDAVSLPVFLKTLGHIDGGRDSRRALLLKGAAAGRRRRSPPLLLFSSSNKKKASSSSKAFGAKAKEEEGKNNNTTTMRTKKTEEKPYAGPPGLATADFLRLTRLFLKLDATFRGRVSCARLPERIVSLDGSDLAFRFACVLANSDVRDSDFFDVDEFFEFGIDVRKKTDHTKKKHNWIDHYADPAGGKLKVPTNLPWTTLLEKLPLENRARQRDFEDALSLLNDRQLRLVARDGSNVFHYLAHRGDPVACKLTLQRYHLHFLLADRNRHGAYPSAVAAARGFFHCVSLFRPWVEYVLDARLYGNKRQRLAELRNLGGLNAHQF